MGSRRTFIDELEEVIPYLSSFLGESSSSDEDEDGKRVSLVQASVASFGAAF